MTREEAIRVLEAWIERDKKMEYADRLENIEIYNMAIKALEQQSCEDCISRAEFMERIKPYDTEDEMDKALYNFAHNIVISCSSVQPTRPTGKWITDVYKLGRDRHTCSDCGKGQEYTTAFCPNCGADMRESEDKK